MNELYEGMRWPGYRPVPVSKERKYTIRRDRKLCTSNWNVMIHHHDGQVISSEDPRLIASERRPPVPEPDVCKLVDAVNRVARKYNGTPGGSFYYNEYNQVLKPVWNNCTPHLRYVGEFPNCWLLFSYGTLWSNRPSHLPFGNLEVGEDWPGPPIGIRHGLDSRMRIFRRIREVDDGFVIEDKEYLDPPNLELWEAINDLKGSSGRFYVTEAGSIWAPYGYSGRRYIGNLWDYATPDGGWFPKTVVSETSPIIPPPRPKPPLVNDDSLDSDERGIKEIVKARKFLNAGVDKVLWVIKRRYPDMNNETARAQAENIIDKAEKTVDEWSIVLKISQEDPYLEAEHYYDDSSPAAEKIFKFIRFRSVKVSVDRLVEGLRDDGSTVKLSHLAPEDGWPFECESFSDLRKLCDDD